MTGDLSMDMKPQVIDNVAEELKSNWTVLYFTMCCIRKFSLCQTTFTVPISYLKTTALLSELIIQHNKVGAIHSVVYRISDNTLIHSSICLIFSCLHVWSSNSRIKFETNKGILSTKYNNKNVCREVGKQRFKVVLLCSLFFYFKLAKKGCHVNSKLSAVAFQWNKLLIWKYEERLQPEEA